MRKDGKGGANTKTGAVFEVKSILQAAIKNLPDYEVRQAKIGVAILYKRSVVAHSYKQHDLYKFLESQNVNYKEYISAKLLPDDAIIVVDSSRVTIVEIKYQETPGSVDEKPQTADFKKRQYEKLFAPLKYEVAFVYVFSTWFKDKRYKDMLEYVKSVGCDYYFEELPLSALGLPGSDDIDVEEVADESGSK